MHRQSEKNLLNSNISSTCADNMVNFGLLTAEICWRVWGTPANSNGFRVLAALLHGTLAVGVSQTAALNRGSQLYSAGRPSRWALAHWPTFLVCFFVVLVIPQFTRDMLQQYDARHPMTNRRLGVGLIFTTPTVYDRRTFWCLLLSPLTAVVQS